MARGVKLVSQFAVLHDSTREVTRSTSFLREAMEKALVIMSADIEARAKSMTSLGRGLRPTWRFGTVVQHVNFEARAIVLTDDGITCEVMTLNYHEVIETGHSVWAPVED